jgi:hypothetical protein
MDSDITTITVIMNIANIIDITDIPDIPVVKTNRDTSSGALRTSQMSQSVTKAVTDGLES